MTQQEFVNLCFIVEECSLVPLAIVCVLRIAAVEIKSLPILVLSLIGEIILVLLYRSTNPYVVNSCLVAYPILESSLMFLQLYFWGGYAKPTWFWSGLLLILFVWGWSVIPQLSWINSFTPPKLMAIRTSIFDIAYSFMIVLLSINVLSKVISVSKLLKRDYKFIFCVCFIVYYTFNILTEGVFIFWEPLGGIETANQAYALKVGLNFIIDLITIYAILCIPRKQTYSSL